MSEIVQDHPVESAPTIAVRRWLIACCVAVVVAVVVGGITRLTESGLSITEWKPVAGVLPPLTAQGWLDAYALFLQIPQAQTTHAGITLSGFKLIYWWEWFHRLLARGVGLIFALPYAWLLWRRAIPPAYRWRLAALPVLTLAQGALGWYMVQSGLVERTTVSAYRLTAHLSLALAILVVALWTYADLRPGARGRPASITWQRVLTVLVAALVLTIVSGGFVAGLRAGTIFNTFPLMGGQVVPPGYLALSGWWTNVFENPVAAQFHHRTLALLTSSAILIATWRIGRGAATPALVADVRRLGAVVVVQVSLGIATLLFAVPVVLGVLHQLTGVLALGAGILALHRARVG